MGLPLKNSQKVAGSKCSGADVCTTICPFNITILCIALSLNKLQDAIQGHGCVFSITVLFFWSNLFPPPILVTFHNVLTVIFCINLGWDVRYACFEEPRCGLTTGLYVYFYYLPRVTLASG